MRRGRSSFRIQLLMRLSFLSCLSVAMINLPCFGIAEAKSENWLQSQIYSQNSYDSRIEDFVSQNRLWALFPNSFSGGMEQLKIAPYLGARVDQDTRSTPEEVYNKNRATPVFGLHALYQPWRIGAFVEASIGDAQLTTYQYGFWSLARMDSDSLNSIRIAPFFEAYTDLTRQSSWAGNAILAHWSKLGLRIKHRSRIDWDLFPELSLHRDRLGWAYENFVDVRYGTRLAYHMSPVSSSVNSRLDSSISMTLTSATGLYMGDHAYLTPLKALLVVALDYAL